jgi:intergrase/recombinase
MARTLDEILKDRNIISEEEAERIEKEVELESREYFEKLLNFSV